MAVTGAMVTRCAFLLPQCMGGSTVVRGSGRQTMAFSSSSIPTLSLRAAPLRHSFMPSSTRNFHSCRVVFSKCVTREEGEIDSATYRVFLSDETGRPMSPWHDIPLDAGDGRFNFVVKVPKDTRRKMEVATCEPFTPFRQDINENGDLRSFPHNMNWNYGLLPQTWEDPQVLNRDVENARGDNDPVDVVEIGERQAKLGEVLKVKVLAVWAMIDEGDLDWKVVVISVDDPKAHLVNNVADVEEHFPGTLTAIRDWFRDYQIPDGKPANRFGLDNKPAEKDYALTVISETHAVWAKYFKW
ncbi:soluble inorganic pyrophosphatase 6, chloroplastic [Physcomitrium patens]|uniref:inorganic diphosphatase n=1 Tax=Physcomitrium patens TaxID=3218 RepID=A0A2K1IDU4_PHYPA|nr:soluble inorganic pyrophosphatase 6, chloroplastic-like [Physcomitrium patens]PNR27451.1 hypothetical protein PHYPA_029603 [Physcomitrium patens]|eukprot:XP_024365057.1 soluble inorganic pyrophosphatase 6, chloroplastic-like [Physcomitrella patens]